jgi:PTS system glucose-specific IIC component
MGFFSNAFSYLQKIGKCMMLPVSVLPVAGILLGVGSANFSWLPQVVSQVMAQSGGAIFSNLPLLFAIGVAIGLTNNDGVAALASTVGFAVFLAAMGVLAKIRGIETATAMGIPTIETGVFGGIIVGLISAWAFNRFYKVQLPSYLGFFAGKRSVPIITAFAVIVAAAIMSFIWPPIGSAINAFSHWAVHGQPALAFTIYGIVERSFIPFGLHHVWNVPFFFQAGDFVDPSTGKEVHGEIARFIAGDPTAGNMTGGYLFKMWALPAASAAITLAARPENRAKIGGVMISAALTAFLTGITEPIEFAFLFVAPILYGIHALLAGAAYFICILLGIRHGFTFSHGLIDYVVLFPKSTNALWLFVLGPIWAGVYFVIFSLIRKFDLKTPGRELGEAWRHPPATSLLQIVRALGGRNIVDLDACITRLRVKQRSKQGQREQAKSDGGCWCRDGGRGGKRSWHSPDVLKTEIGGVRRLQALRLTKWAPSPIKRRTSRHPAEAARSACRREGERSDQSARGKQTSSALMPAPRRLCRDDQRRSRRGGAKGGGR